MNRRFLLSAATLLLMLPGGCGDAPDDGSKRYPDYRYRLTVEVDTPEGLRSGSSVIEVKTARAGKNSIPTPNAIHSRARDEAVTVDLGKGGMLFVLLSSESSVDWAKRALLTVTPAVTMADAYAAGLRSDFDPSFEILMKRALALEGQHEISRYVNDPRARIRARNQGTEVPSGYPIMVRFENVNDPTTVKLVDPDDLSKSFGADFKLRRITVERTNDEVTEGIEKKLRWLKSVGKARGTLIPNPPRVKAHATDPVIQYLSPGYFSTELYK